MMRATIKLWLELLQKTKFWVQSIFLIAGVNTSIFIFKGLVLGFKAYYVLQLSISLIIILFLWFVIIPALHIRKRSQSSWQAVVHFIHYRFFFPIINRTLSTGKFLCSYYASSKWIWLFTCWNFFHMIYVTLLALLTWNCTMYVRISFALCFVFFIFGVKSLRNQYNKIPLIIAKDIKTDSLLNQPNVDIVAPITEDEVTNSPVLAYTRAQQHPFHILLSSFLPFFTAYFLYDFLFSMVLYLNYGYNVYCWRHLQISSLWLVLILTIWFWNVVQEANEGHHTQAVRWNLLHGFCLFIVSEIMLFFAIFWAFFHNSLSPSVAIYCMWPPYGITPINPFGLPFLNTVLLLSSGITLTYAHTAMALSTPEKVEFYNYDAPSHRWVYNTSINYYRYVSHGLIWTLALGILFTCVQGFEYVYSSFSINDSIYGSVFFFSTGFHGGHVLIGSIMLLVSLIRNSYRQLSHNQHGGFLSAIWYWHFVDIVWIFLFLTIYWWGF